MVLAPNIAIKSINETNKYTIQTNCYCMWKWCSW